MSEKCGKCKDDISPSSISAKCVECQRSFHLNCTRAGSQQNFTKSQSKTWKCDDCADETSSKSSVRSSEEVDDRKSILEAIRLMKIDINKNTDDKINKVLTSVSTLSEEMKNLRSDVSTLQSAQSELEEKCSRLERENEDLQDDVRELRLQQRDLEQYQRAANIEIVGLPRTEGENIFTCLQHIAVALGVHFKNEDVSMAHRLRLYGRRHSHPPIICQFVSRSVKTAWLTAARAKQSFNARDVSSTLPSSPLYINDHLTRDNKALLGRARRMQREKKIHQAGVFNGKILIKVTAGEDSIQVRDLSQLDQWDKK